ncbi:MAG: DUF4065 domain-containing protein [Methanosarcinaceae archaeon]|nr:DUF4065 domain-containing protein [Methanosarcinaceae archaeon]
MIVKGGGKTESDVQYSAKDVSDHIINYCSSVGRPITNLELQKILYFVAGEFFRISGRDIIAEDFESWQIGPVIPGVYDTFSIYGGDPLKPVSTKAKISPEDTEVINRVVDRCIGMPAWELVRKTNETDPWKRTYSMFGRWARISKYSMKRYFENL